MEDEFNSLVKDMFSNRFIDKIRASNDTYRIIDLDDGETVEDGIKTEEDAWGIIAEDYNNDHDRYSVDKEK